ncbi:MAG: thiolase family protein [Deltaproteobacteria bacterium]|nr:thiolase family protein [Deltaproteobacteria bacterium]MBI2341492.1 thiolase family protein [Deltaproteobacteria bacterium]MBI2975284.1 thiolase family protein [Deltaproteobacteria bacterium]
MEQAVIVAAVRSPLAKAGKGAFADLRIDDVCAEVLRGALQRVPRLNPKLIEDVLIGCAMPEGEQGLNVARNVSFLAGLPLSCGAATINRFCSSSLEAINQAARAIMCGDGECFIAGGVESMSHVPMGGFNPSLNEKLMKDGMPAAYIGMGETAEKLANKYKISREEQDKYSLASHQKAVAAIKSGKFKDEIVPIRISHPDPERSRGERISGIQLGDSSVGALPQNNIIVMQDEGPREDTALEKLAALKPAFLKDGTVTAGNSSQMTDGAAITIVMSKSLAKKLKIKPLARIISMAVAGCDPSTMGEGPIFAVPKALKRAGMKLKEIDLVELNEAFASQTIAVVRGLRIDTAKLNIHGGAIALGHPLGATGARCMATLINALRQYKKSIGLETMCVGGGQGVATIIERI